MGPGETAGDRLADPPGEHDAASVDGEIAMARLSGADLVGRRVNIGNAGSGHRLAMERVMAALRVTHRDFALVTELPPEAQNEALCDDRVDAVVYAAGNPNGIVQDAIRRCGGRLVPMSGPRVEALLASHPEYTRAVIPAGLYPQSFSAIQAFGLEFSHSENSSF